MATTTTPPGGVAPIRKVRRGGPAPVQFYRSAIGKKWVMAVTGIILMGFVLGHLIGNLKLFISKEELNLYGEALRDIPGHLLPRTVLLWTVADRAHRRVRVPHPRRRVAHASMNRRARPDSYKSKRDYIAADFASRTMRWTGIIVALFIFFHLLDLTWGTANPEFVRGDPYNNLVYSMQRVPVAIVYILANIALAFHLYHGSWSLFQSLGHQQPEVQHRAASVRARCSPASSSSATCRSRSRCNSVSSIPRARTRIRSPLARRSPAYDARFESPRGRPRREVGQPQVRDQARQPGEQAALRHHRRRHRARRRVGGRVARRARIQREGHHLPRLAPPRALDRRAGRHQRGEELQERRRQHLPALLRHDQGRRLPRTRRQRVPARAGVGRHHRPVRRAGRAVRARVRRAARQPLLRRRAGVAHVLRAWPDRPATAARCLPGADAPGARGRRSSCTRGPRCSTSSSRTAGPPASCAATSTPAKCSRCRGTRSCSRPAATATSSTSRRTPRTRTSPRRGAHRSAARTWPTRASPRSTPRASRRATTSSRSSRSCRSRCATTAGSGCRSRWTTRARRTRSPRPTATTSSSGATRRSATSCRATSRRARSSARSTPGAASGR